MEIRKRFPLGIVNLNHNRLEEKENLEEVYLHNRLSAKDACDLLLDEKHMGISFTCKATINSVVESTEWYFGACPLCRIRHGLLNGQKWCFKCKREVKAAIPR